MHYNVDSCLLPELLFHQKTVNFFAITAFRLCLRCQDPEDQIFHGAISDISVVLVVLGETTLTMPNSIETDSPVETVIVRVVSLSTREITEIT